MEKLILDKEARKGLLNGVLLIRDGVKPTLGARGGTVILESKKFINGYTVTKDGVTVANSISSEDNIEDLAIKIVREASRKTANNAGDGTTSTIIIAAELINKGLELLEGQHKTEILRRMNDIVNNDLLKYIKKRAVNINESKIKDISYISCNSDREISDIITKAFTTGGYKNKIVVKDKSQDTNSYFEVNKGIVAENGFSHHAFINNKDSKTFEAQDCKVLVSNVRIDSPSYINDILQNVVKNKEDLLIISEMTDQVKDFFIGNAMQKTISICHIEPPFRGWQREDFMRDIAELTGAEYFGEETIDISSSTYEGSLGVSPSVIVDENRTVIIKNKDVDAQPKINDIKSDIKNNKDPKKVDFLKRRLSSYNGGIGVVYAGGNTDVEQKELLDRIDDAICAVNSAIDGGIVAGGGTVFKDFIIEMDKNIGDDDIAWEILKSALIAPYQTIINNAEIDYCIEKKEGYGIDVITGKPVNFNKAGIIDPVKVLKESIINAMSVATVVLSTEAIVLNDSAKKTIITNARKV